MVLVVAASQENIESSLLYVFLIGYGAVAGFNAGIYRAGGRLPAFVRTDCTRPV
jgi:hypothetical protein